MGGSVSWRIVCWGSLGPAGRREFQSHKKQPVPPERKCRPLFVSRVLARCCCAHVPCEECRANRCRAGLWLQRVSVGGGVDVPCLVCLPRGRGQRNDVARLSTRDNVCHAFCTLLPAAADVPLLLAKGYSQRGIAGKLDVSDNTVRTHMRNLYRMLQIHSRQEAIELVEGFGRVEGVGGLS